MRMARPRTRRAPRPPLLALALAAVVGVCGSPARADSPAIADEAPPGFGPDAGGGDAAEEPRASPPAAPAKADANPAPTATEAPRRHSWAIPIVETLTIDIAVWAVARATNGQRDPDWSIKFPDFITRYPLRAWQFDLDDFDTNQFLHPYHFHFAFTAARSSGLHFWESALFPLLGSLAWELLLETQAPSVNDQITSTLGGSFVGEALFRLSDMVLLGGGDSPGVLRQIGAFLVSPMASFNRLVFGYPNDIERPISSLVQFTAGAAVGAGTVNGGPTKDTGFRGFGAVSVTQFGVNGWHARRPFEHFDFSAGFGAGAGATVTGGQANAQWYLLVSGLLVPAPLGDGESSQGLWGLFGGYEYDEPSALRVSASTLGLGVTGQCDLGGHAVLQGTAVGSWVILGVSESAGASTTLRAYKAGPSLEALLDGKLLVGDAAWLRLSARQYLLLNPVNNPGWEEITRATASLLVRIWGPHSLVLEGELARRTGHYPGFPDDHQSIAFARFAYSFLSDPGLGYVPPPRVP